MPKQTNRELLIEAVLKLEGAGRSSAYYIALAKMSTIELIQRLCNIIDTKPPL